jgi:hypothetical protein
LLHDHTTNAKDCSPSGGGEVAERVGSRDTGKVSQSSM